VVNQFSVLNYNSSRSGYQTRELEILPEFIFRVSNPDFTKRALKMFLRQRLWPFSLSCHKSICYLDFPIRVYSSISRYARVTTLQLLDWFKKRLIKYRY
jgi:hypothetical protein